MLDFEVDTLDFTQGNIIDLLKLNGTRVKHFQIKKLLEEKWKLTPSSPKSYNFYSKDFSGENTMEHKKGRFYTFSKSLFQNKSVMVYIKDYYKDFKDSLALLKDSNHVINMTKEFNGIYKMNITKDEFLEYSLSHKKDLHSVALLQSSIN